MFDLDSFRSLYPQFATLTDDQVLATSAQAQCFLTDQGCDCSAHMWLLMVAHMLTLGRQASTGGVSGQVTSASIDKVSVSFAAPPSGNDAWAYWLSLTPFGVQLRALLKRCTAGGFYFGGLPERAGFRSVGGVFPRGGRVWRR
jgi:hypothetical protein